MLEKIVNKVFIFRERIDAYSLFPLTIFCISTLLFAAWVSSINFFVSELINWFSYEVRPDNISHFNGLSAFQILLPFFLLVLVTFAFVISIHLWREKIDRKELSRICNTLLGFLAFGLLSGFIIGFIPILCSYVLKYFINSIAYKGDWSMVPMTTLIMGLALFMIGMVLTFIPKKYIKIKTVN